MEISEVYGIRAGFSFEIRFITEVRRGVGTIPVARGEWMMVEMKATTDKEGRKALNKSAGRGARSRVGGKSLIRAEISQGVGGSTKGNR